MRVLYITDPGSVGGAARSLVDVVTAMKEKGVEPIVCTSFDNELNRELDEKGITNYACGHRAAMDLPAFTPWKRPFKYVLRWLDFHISYPFVVRRIENQIPLKSVDLIHTNSARNDIGCALSRRYGIPHIMHIREFGREDFGCICYRRHYEEHISRWTDALIAISQAVERAWIDKGVNAAKIRVIYNGVSDEEIEPRDVGAEDPSILKMVAVGGVCEPKGQLQIVEAMGLLPKNIQDRVSLDLIGWGDDNYIALMKRCAKEMGIQDRIRFLGACGDVGKRLKNYHVGLICSRAEGFGRVTAEYMHARLGVIASDAGANPELIADGERGQLYKLYDTVALAGCIKKYYEDRAWMNEMADAGREYAKEHYTRLKNAELIYELYTELVR